MKICRKCGGAERYANGRCAVCARETNRRFAEAHPERFREYHRKYYAANPEKYIARSKKHYVLDPEKAKARAHRYRLKHPEKVKEQYRRYRSANVGQIRARQRLQAGLPVPTRPEPRSCECCGTSAEVDKRALALDHDHTTGKFRGWLCRFCNQAMGHLGDSVEGLERALNYLRRAA